MRFLSLFSPQGTGHLVLAFLLSTRSPGPRGSALYTSPNSGQTLQALPPQGRGTQEEPGPLREGPTVPKQEAPLAPCSPTFAMEASSQLSPTMSGGVFSHKSFLRTHLISQVRRLKFQRDYMTCSGSLIHAKVRIPFVSPNAKLPSLHTHSLLCFPCILSYFSVTVDIQYYASFGYTA